jgi:hypothetical protein
MVAHEIGLSHPASQASSRARRIVSEDSLCRVAALATTIHLLSQEQDLSVVRVRHDLLNEQLCRFSEELEVMSLRPDEREAAKERNDPRPDIRKAVHLPVPAAIAGSSCASARQRLAKQVERSPICLRHIESRRELPASGVIATRATHDHKAGFSQREPGQEIPEIARDGSDREPFLLIVCTRHIVTVLPEPDRTSSAGYPEFPAYSRVL